MKPADALFAPLATAAGIWSGAGLGGSVGAVAGGLTGALLGIAVAVLGIRVAVAIPVLVGMVAGGVLGRGIVHALCLPGSCRGAETTAALLTGAGALVGVGLVVALVTRSFDEYRGSPGGDPDTRHQTPDTRPDENR